LRLLVLCFVLSGAGGLVLEVVWTRLLGQVFGATSLAIATVLATFMGGLALGSIIGGRIADRLGRRRLLAVYAACEIAIAGLALVIPHVIDALRPANAWLWANLEGHPSLLALVRALLGALVLLPPTVLMGATLPLLARQAIQTEEELGLVGKRVGALYAANTGGAVLGAALAGFFLIPSVGLRHANFAGAGIDLGVALLVILVLARSRDVPPAPAPDVPETPGPRSRLALVAFGLSGAVAMTLEVLWSRALALVIGSSVYSFTLVLVVFLIGLSTGAAWIGRRASRALNPLGVLGIVLLAAGGATALTLLVIDKLPTIFLALLTGKTLGVGTVWAIQAFLCALAILPTALCLGAVMPLALRAYAGSVRAVGRDVGRAYAANTIGAIIGSFAGGFVVLPMLGLETGVRLCAIADAVLGLVLAWRAFGGIRRASLVAAPAVIGLAVLAPPWDVTVLHSGVFRMNLAKYFVSAGQVIRPELVFFQDGVGTTVTVERHGANLAMKNNGKVEASTQGDMPTQVLVGLLPTILHGGEAQSVAVVGYGSGITVGAIAQNPYVSRVDVVELEPAVIKAADQFFGLWNHDAHKNPKVHRYIGDGRNFLTARPTQYDVIVSEPSNPWIAGVASLFTREFYALARRRLAPGGVFCQWAQLYELGPRSVKMIYRTFNEAFPYVYAFSAGDSSADTILIGSDRPLPLDMLALEEVFREPDLAVEMQRAKTRGPADLVAMLMISPGEIASFSAGAEINTDDSARLEFRAPRDLVEAGIGPRFADQVYGPGWPYGHLEGVVSTGTGPGGTRRAAELAHALVVHGKRREASAWIERATASGNGDGVARAAKLLALVEGPDVLLTDGGPPLKQPDASWFAGRDATGVPKLSEMLDAVMAGEWAKAELLVNELPGFAADTDAGKDGRFVWAYILFKRYDLDEAARMLELLIDDDDYRVKRPALLYYRGLALYAMGQFETGAAQLERYLEARGTF
jgi:spermidine synthase